MRKIRGHIINLADALGPPPGTVEVHAYLNDDDDPGDVGGNLDLAVHDLGYLNVVHQAGPGGSGSPTEANAEGHFGWDMEFSPGPITTRIAASDPSPTQYRARFPDESAQIGKAFHSDLERLGWTAGRDCLVWGAIEGVAQPTAAEWGTTPLTSSGQGDWGVLTSGTGVTAGRVLLKRGIGFLGGVVFSIEAADLVVPVPGEEAGIANPGTTDRWDLLVAVMHNDPTQPTTYGKQRIVIQQGPADGKIPALTPVAGQRRMVLHALKVAAGGTTYSEVTDLRTWNKPPSTTIPGLAPSTVRNYCNTAVAVDGFDVTNSPSTLNNTMANDEVILPLDTAWTGMAIYTVNLALWSAGQVALFYCTTEGRSTQGGSKVDGTDYAVPPTGEGAYRVPLVGGSGTTPWNHVAATFPLRRIPSGAEGRTWHRLRFAVRHATTGGGLYAVHQSLAVNLWPVP